MEDYLSAPIPEIHKTLFSWVQRFTHCSWDYNASDVAALRGAGLSDRATGQRGERWRSSKH